MPKVQNVYILEVYEDDKLVSSIKYPCAKAEDTFLYYVQIAVKLRFHNIDRFRLIAGNHIIFEFRDLRKIVNQKSFML